MLAAIVTCSVEGMLISLNLCGHWGAAAAVGVKGGERQERQSSGQRRQRERELP